MPVYYKVYQDNSTNTKRRGKWYGRAAYMGTVDEYDLAKSIEAKCTVHRADVVAVILALIDEMTRALQSSQRVKLHTFGTFKMGLSSTPAVSHEKFSAENIKNLHILFQPETKVDRTAGTRTRAMIAGARVKELTAYVGADKKSGSKSGGSSSSSNTPASGGSTSGGSTSGSPTGGSTSGSTSGSSTGSSTGGSTTGSGSEEDF